MVLSPPGRRAGLTSTSSRRRNRLPRARTRGGVRPPPELAAAGLAARKRLGQHFLTNARVLQRIADALDLASGCTVVEVGPGLGGLTAALLARGAHVAAVEVDAGLCRYLERRFAGADRFHLLCADILKVGPADILAAAALSPPYAVAGNLPYNIAAAVVRHFLESTPPPDRLVVMLQREVAQNMAARPGRMSLLSLSVQLYATPRVLFTVPPTAFYPPPRVQSAVVRLDVAPSLRAAIGSATAFFEVARAGFATPRKQLRNTLAAGLALTAEEASDMLTRAGIDPTRRPQELTLEEWAALTRAWEERTA